jgi:hypothetical protein
MERKTLTEAQNICVRHAMYDEAGGIRARADLYDAVAKVLEKHRPKWVREDVLPEQPTPQETTPNRKETV